MTRLTSKASQDGSVGAGARLNRLCSSAFDLLMDGEPVIDQSYAARRAALVGLDLPAVVVTPSYAWDDAPALLVACEDTGMEGIARSASTPRACRGSGPVPGGR